MEEGREDVICEVIDLYYGIEVPQVPSASDDSMFFPGSTTAAAAEAEATAKPATKKRVLLNGVNCRLCAGDMVAVIVSFIDYSQSLIPARLLFALLAIGRQYCLETVARRPAVCSLSPRPLRYSGKGFSAVQ